MSIVASFHGETLGYFTTKAAAARALANARRRYAREKEKRAKEIEREKELDERKLEEYRWLIAHRGNPSKSLTLRNMASVTIKRGPKGSVLVTGRKLR
jgi:transposase-like protein